MKNKLIIALTALPLLFASCKKQEENKIAKGLESIDSEIANGIDNLKDTLKIKHDTVFVNNQFNRIALDKNFVTLDGGEKSFKNIIAENKSKTIVIDIWASWCPDCIKGFPSLKKVQKEYPDAVYVFISLDKTEEAWKEAIEKYHLKGSHYYLNEKMSGEFGKAIDLDWVPRYMIINKEGKIVDYKSIVADDKTFLFTLKKSEKKQ